jgi:hypothetical protein
MIISASCDHGIDISSQATHTRRVPACAYLAGHRLQLLAFVDAVAGDGVVHYIGAPCPPRLRHGDPMHAQKRLTEGNPQKLAGGLVDRHTACRRGRGKRVTPEASCGARPIKFVLA